MDTNTVWQWRIKHVRKYSGCPDPFHYSSKVGLDFNVKANTQKKLDLQLVTNGVILEVCDFAETVNKGEKHFITDILENNFSLGLENEQQRIDFTSQLLHKLKDLFRNPPADELEVFTLFDSSECTSNSNNCLNKASTERKTDSFTVEMDDTNDGKHEDKFKCSQITSRENKMTLSHSEEMDQVQKSKCSGEQSTKEVKEDVLLFLFPYCEEIGLNLGIGAKQSLDLGLLTKGVMLELVHFSRVLTASYSQIILDVLEHNFDLDLKNKLVKNQVWSHVSHLLERRKKFENEPFSFQSKPVKRPRESALSNVRVKRLRRGQSEHKETNQFSHYINLCTSTKIETDHDYSCPGGDADLDSDKVTPGNTSSQNHTENQRNTDIPTESESSCLGIDVTFLTTSGQSSSSQTMNSNMNPTVASQHDERWLCAGNEQTQTPTNALNDCDMDHKEMKTENYSICPVGESDLDSNQLPESGKTDIEDHVQNSKSGSLSLDIPRDSESSFVGDSACFLTSNDALPNLQTINSNMDTANKCDMEQEEMGMDHNIWKLRANRVVQILSTTWKDFDPLKWSRKCGLTFSVGFGPKQNISIDSLTNPVLLEIAEFALAINASQKDFIMEILDYNFDLSLQNQQHRNIFACEVMNRVRQLRSCEDAVKVANEVFELPGLVPELSSISRMEKCDVASMQLVHTESKELRGISHKSVDVYPCCKEIGLKLHVNNSQPRKKLDINKLTNGAMTEVTNFAEKLSGTFEQICLDILEHNFDLDLQSGDSNRARNILAQISAAVEQRNLSTSLKSRKKPEGTIKGTKTMKKLDSQNNPNLDAHRGGSCQEAFIDQNAGSSADTEHKNELDLELWKLRANHIQRILSIPHEEHCPLYSYSRCKKLGIDFNVGSGVKENLDPKLLTNGIMVEFNTFAAALILARKHFVTEILEYNFNLNLKNELDRNAFGQQTLEKFDSLNKVKRNILHRNEMLFELPDLKCIQEPTHDKTIYCPKCHQDRNHRLHQDEFGGNRMHHPHAMTDTVSVDAKPTVQKPATDPLSTFSTIEETIMNSYPLCKKIGLNLCVDKNQPKEKLDRHVLTFKTMKEVTNFAVRLCGYKRKIIHTLLEHNFNIYEQHPSVDFVQMLRKAYAVKDGGVAWFSEVFVIRPVSHRLPGQLIEVKGQSAMSRNERKEVIKERQLALQRKQERATLPSHNMHYPICTEIGLNLEVTSKSGEKEKLDLKLLTRAVVFEIHEFATQKVGHYYPRTVFDILDCNFDLRSQHYRRWEFSIATASKIQTMVKQYCKNDGADEVFKLPFLFDPQASERLIEKDQMENNDNSTLDFPSNSEASGLGICTPFLTSADVSSSLPTVNSNVNPPFGTQPDKRNLCGREEQTKTPENVHTECDIDQEDIGTENYYTCPLGESDLDSDEVTDSENTAYQDPLQNPEAFSLSSDITSESESNCQAVSVPFLASSDVSSSLPAFASQLNEKGLCGGEEQTPTPRYAPDDCDKEQEEIGTENLWKLRANRVEQILSALNKEFGPFNRSKKLGLEFNVGFGPNQNISVDFFSNSVLLEIAEFAVAINSSQQNFIMEILEYNFDLSLQGQQHRNIFICEIMNRVRQLSSCEDVVKFSKEVFELPVPMTAIIMANQNEGSVIPELSSMSKMQKCDVTSTHPSDAETKEHTGMSHKSVDLYPCCEEIGLKLHVNSQARKKLDFNKLTNGAMTEVTNFTEKLCGTFEQICLDILRHNLSCDLQSGDSDLARITFARIPAAIEQRNLSATVKVRKKIRGTRKEISKMKKLDPQNNPNLDAHGAGFSQTANIDKNVGSSVEIERKKELDLKLWKLRANHIQRILSIPHEEHCPLYSYSRCKKLGIDFNVGSGVKQNLDPKLLTNGIMAEFYAFAITLLSAKKHFIIEIMENNFNLSFKNELYRNGFAQQMMVNLQTGTLKKIGSPQKPFELPDMRSISELPFDKSLYCPKCYHDRNHKLHQYESDKGHMNHPHPHAMSDTVSADENYTAEQPATDPSSTLSKIEKTIIDSYPRCKKIGLNLCVDIDKPKDKLDPHVLTQGIMNEVLCFALVLCGKKNRIIYDLVEHNFNIDLQHQDVNLQQLSSKARKEGGVAWFDEVFLIHPISHKQPGNVRKVTQKSSMHVSERKQTIQKRRLALQRMEEKATQPSQNVRIVKSKSNNHSTVNLYPICTEIGLDLDVTSKSGEKEKIDLNLLTTSVLSEILKFTSKKVGQYFPSTLFDILDYNFDISSQYYRRWEFSLAAASKVQTEMKQYRLNRDRPEKIFKLPFVFPPKKEKKQRKKSKKHSQKEPNKKRNKGNEQQVGYHLDGDSINFPGGVNTNEDTIFQTMNGQKNECLVAIGSTSPLQRNMKLKEEYDVSCGNMTQQPHQYDFVKLESNTWDVEHVVLGEPAETLGYPLTTMHPNLGSNITPKLKNEDVQYYMMAESQRSEGHTYAESNIKTEPDMAEYLNPVEAAASLGYSIITIDDGNESAVIKEEQENVLLDTYSDGVVSYTESDKGN